MTDAFDRDRTDGGSNDTVMVHHYRSAPELPVL